MRKLICAEYDASESEIDSRYFNIPSARAVLKEPCASAEKQAELIEFMRGFEFNVIINKSNNPFNNGWIGEKTSAFLTDINVHFEKKIAPGAKFGDEEMVHIADSFPPDPRIVEIAETSFEFSRFLNDPYLPRDKAQKIYGDIVTNAFEKPGRFFAHADLKDRVVGFLLFSLDLPRAIATINLVAVDPQFKGLRLGSRLLLSMERFITQQGCERIAVGTQVDNQSAVNFYLSRGFKLVECNSIYHFWPLV